MVSRLKNKRLLYGFLVAPAVMILFVLYSALLGRSDPTIIDSFCADQTCECVDWFRSSVGYYQVENNVWNKSDNDIYQQCVYISKGDEGINAGWAWNWPGARFDVVAYPNIMYGKNPWLPTTSPEFPLRIDEINCLETEFEVIQDGSGKGNLAFDLWITSSASAQPSDITHEIMIWLSHEGIQTAGSLVDVINIDGNEIELFEKENHNPSDEFTWTYLAFVYQSDLTEGSIDLDILLSYLVENGYIGSDHYLAAIQLGNEIVSGYGQSLIRNYEIRICEE
ncbi:MAG: hypothetical protein ACERKY_03330 [Anaerolineales bacterium]